MTNASFISAWRSPATAAFCWALASASHALVVPPPGAESRIAQVKVYPGSATVERVARALAGSRSITFGCLPAGLDVQSLQVVADAAVRIGETSVQTEPRALSARCAGSPLDSRIRALEDRKAVLQAEADALGLVTGYLKGVAVAGESPGSQRGRTDAKQLVAVADALRRTGQDTLHKQHQIQRQQKDIDREIAPLLAERSRIQGSGDGGQVLNVTVTLAAPVDADVRLTYQVNGPGWMPSYRALLDTATQRVRIERQALVAQATGEDWRGVKLVLSTGQPRRETTGRLPTPWRIGVEPPPPPRSEASARQAPLPMAPAPAMAAAPSLDRMGREDAALFDVSVFQGTFATEFNVPQSVDVPSSGQRVALSLGQHEDAARLAVRTSPRIDASAFLIADLAPPAGVWPAGALQLYRDGAFVGQGRWNPTNEARLTLSFGRDELVRVLAEPEQDGQGSGGFAGSRAERKVQRAYVVENRHRTPMAVEIIEAAPVSVDEQVRVTAQFAPLPGDTAWKQQPGVARWTLNLAAGQTARVAADYTIRYPKEARLQER